MFTDTATSILRRSSPRFDFANRHRLYGEDLATARAMELGVRFDGALVGYLEHNEMPDRQSVEEVLAIYYDTRGGGVGDQEKAAYGIRWNEAIHKPRHYRMYVRASWQDCFRKIMAMVPRDVQRRIRRRLRREGYTL
jgi:hypothetical protein